MDKWQDTEKGRVFINKVFSDIGMPEVTEAQLEVGTYTNAQLASHFEDPIQLYNVLCQLNPHNSAASNRSILSFRVEMMPKKD